MTILSKPLRRQLENAVKEAREIAEAAAQEAIARLGVADPDAPAHLSDHNKLLRRRLRAHGRTLGDRRDAAGGMTTAKLQDAAAYELWHRMLFGRFLAERGLLLHPELGVSISLSELRELAREEGITDEWALAEQYAAPGLPGVFKPNDPVLALLIAPEFSKRLRTLLSRLPGEVFAADDSLGWTYQFWRASEKDAVNQSGVKIGAAELPSVTQLFTESYIVKFLLHNTLGAWWAGKVLAANPRLARNAADEAELRAACSIEGVSWEFLRFNRENKDNGLWQPAVGDFPGWPTRAAEITYCDPCCGSGHFLVEAFNIIFALRTHEEELSPSDAVVAVLKQNLHGLELDGRCVQIAAFNISLTAWKLAQELVVLPSPHIAWVAAPPPMARAEMSALGNGDDLLRHAFELLHDQFTEAPMLGSLMEVGSRDLLDSAIRQRGGIALSTLRDTETERAEGGLAAKDLLDAVDLLARRYVLLATNVPFLGRGKQAADLADHIARSTPEAKGDLATAMLQKMRRMAMAGGAVAVVTPQNWLFLGQYRRLREDLIASASFRLVAAIGEHGFESAAAAGAFTALAILQNVIPEANNRFFGLDAHLATDPSGKATLLLHGSLASLGQAAQKSNPQSAISIEGSFNTTLLREYASAIAGVNCGDEPHYGRDFWEIYPLDKKWELQVSAPSVTSSYSGYQYILLWEDNAGRLRREVEEKLGVTGANAWLRGSAGWGKFGVIASLMRDLPVSLYTGKLWDGNTGVIVPKSESYLPAIWAFCSSDEFHKLVRKMNRKVSITLAALVDIPFDLSRWQAVADIKYPDGIPKPHSDDPTQWLFHGHPAFAKEGTELHVALARLAGYRWPAENGKIQLSELATQRMVSASALQAAEGVGILPLHPSHGAASLADLMRQLLALAFGEPLSPDHERRLVRSADLLLDKKEVRGSSVEDWLSERAFRQHCILFDQRPFLWHIWDGMKDGFSAFVHYHRLDRSVLDNLTYTVLGNWIRTAKAAGSAAKLERAERLQQALAKILEGENPFDIFVRWKALADQPMGWEPDLDDGVRLNIRPFMTARILREQPKGISWNKDRGANVASAPWFELGPQYGGKQGDRINDHHTTLAEKRAARGFA